MPWLRHYGQRGYSLAEVVVALVVTSILILSVLPFIKANIRSYLEVKAGKEIMQSARIGFNRMIAEMQRIESAIDISQGYDTRIDFDIPDDGYGVITYQYTSGVLEREGVTLVEGVRSFLIRYYRADGVQKSTPFFYNSNVWRMQITMNVGDDDHNFTFQSQVSPRNLHY